MCNGLKDQLKPRSVGFSDCKQNAFYSSQWGRNRIFFIAFRTLLFVYMLGWLLGHVIAGNTNFWLYLTNWLEVLITIYFAMALAVSVYGHRQIKAKESEGQQQLRWFHSVTWILFSAAFDYALVVDLVFWTVLVKSVPAWFAAHPINYHLHLVNFLLLLLDLMVSAFPVRLLHFVYGLMLGIAYAVFSILMHLTGTESSIYPIVDWKARPGRAILVLAMFGLVAAPLAHVIAYCLFRLRSAIARCLGIQPLFVSETTHPDAVKSLVTSL